jgi:hypothetical protein
MNDDNRLRLNTRLPPILWKALRRLASQDGITHDQEVRKLIADAGGVPALDSQDAPGSTISPSTLLDPHQPIRRS